MRHTLQRSQQGQVSDSSALWNRNPSHLGSLQYDLTASQHWCERSTIADVSHWVGNNHSVQRSVQLVAST